jgi:DNA-binding response OmpR family regulator
MKHLFKKKDNTMSTPIQKPREIVIIDDDSTLTALLETALREEGFEPHVCGDSRQALEFIAKVQPVAVLLDVRMPHVDGFALLRQLRTTPSGYQLPVIVMSGAWRPNENGRQLGATSDRAPTVALAKPFTLKALMDCLHSTGVGTHFASGAKHAHQSR